MGWGGTTPFAVCRSTLFANTNMLCEEDTNNQNACNLQRINFF
jgi:hypothetical protein